MLSKPKAENFPEKYKQQKPRYFDNVNCDVQDAQQTNGKKNY